MPEDGRGVEVGRSCPNYGKEIPDTVTSHVSCVQVLPVLGGQVQAGDLGRSRGGAGAVANAVQLAVSQPSPNRPDAQSHGVMIASGHDCIINQ